MMLRLATWVTICMRRAEPRFIDIYAGWLGAAMTASRYQFHLFLAFSTLALISISTFTLINLALGDSFLASESFQHILTLLTFPVFAVGIGSVLLVAFAWWGFWHFQIADLSVNLHEIGQSLTSELRRPARTGPVAVASAVAGALTVGAVAAGIGVAISWNEWRAPGIYGVTVATIAIVILALALVQLLPKMTKRLYARRRDAEEESDLILLLRAFKGDARHTRNRGLLQPITLEGTVVHMLERYARVVAVADPGNGSQPVGAERVPLAMAEWQRRVLTLMDKAAAIVIALDESPGIVWELERAMEGERLKKTIFVAWSGEHGWPKGPWADFARHLETDVTDPGATCGAGHVALAAICVEDRMMIATARASTPYTNTIATMALLYQLRHARSGQK